MIFALGVGWGFCLAFLLYCAWTAPEINEPEAGSFPGAMIGDE